MTRTGARLAGVGAVVWTVAGAAAVGGAVLGLGVIIPELTASRTPGVFSWIKASERPALTSLMTSALVIALLVVADCDAATVVVARVTRAHATVGANAANAFMMCLRAMFQNPTFLTSAAKCGASYQGQL